MVDMPYPVFWMYKDNAGEWRWTYYASNAEEIAVSSEGYKKRVDCERGIELMRTSTKVPTWMPTDLTKSG